MDKIKRISWVFRLIFQGLFVAMPIFLIIGWIYAPLPIGLFADSIKMTVIPTAYAGAIFHPLTNLEKFEGFLLGLVSTGIDLLILYFLIKLFKLYEQGKIFTTQHVRLIRNIGFSLLLTQLFNPISQFVMGFILTWHNPPGERIASIGLDQTNAGILFTALLVILISWIIAEAAKLNEDQQLTI